MEALGKEDTLGRMIKVARKVGAVARLWSGAFKDRLDRTEDHGNLDKAAELSHIKAQREKLHRLIAEEAELCETLGAPPYVPPASEPIPSEQELHQLSRHIAKLTEDGSAHLLFSTRKNRFSALRKEIIAMVQLVDAMPESQTEQDIVLGDPADYQHSASSVKTVEQYLLRLKDLEAKRRLEHASLVEQLALYWERLDTPLAEREKLKRSHSGLTVATLNALRQQTAECEVLKRREMKDFITRVRKELPTWFRVFCAPECKAQLEEDWVSEEWSQVRLEKLERELKTLENFGERRSASWLLDYWSAQLTRCD